MTTKVNRWMVLTALSAMLTACYGGGELPAPEEGETGEAEAALTCEDECYQGLRECTAVCPPDDPSLPTNYCLDDCYDIYSQCVDGC